MRRIMMIAVSLFILGGCSMITDSITGAIERTVKDTIDKTVQGAEQTAKDKLDDILKGGSGTVNATLDNPFRLKMDQTGYIKSEELKIKFLSITEDSRCPSDVQCIQAGQVTAQINVTRNSINVGNFSLILKTNSNMNIQKIDNYTFTLNSVEPISFKSDRKPQASEYIITLTVKI